MSAVVDVKTLVIDGKNVSARAGQTILEVAREHNIEIPTLCHLDGLSDVGACRLCVVEIKGSNKLGIHNWADKFVGRGLLLDVHRYCADKGRKVNPLSNEKYTLDELKGALTAQKCELKPGTVLLVRTGWMQAYLAASADQKREMGDLPKLKACGIEDSRAMVEWLWDNRVAAIGTDCPAVEAWPWAFKDPGALHYRTLSLLGLPVSNSCSISSRPTALTTNVTSSCWCRCRSISSGVSRRRQMPLR